MTRYMWTMAYLHTFQEGRLLVCSISHKSARCKKIWIHHNEKSRPFLNSLKLRRQVAVDEGSCHDSFDKRLPYFRYQYSCRRKTHTIVPAIPERCDRSNFYNITSSPPRARECPPASQSHVLHRPQRLPLLGAPKIPVCQINDP